MGLRRQTNAAMDTNTVTDGFDAAAKRGKSWIGKHAAADSKVLMDEYCASYKRGLEERQSSLLHAAAASSATWDNSGLKLHRNMSRAQSTMLL